MYNQKVVVLRASKKHHCIGKDIANHLNAYDVTAGFFPKYKIPDGAYIFNYGVSKWPVWANDALARGCKFINSSHSVSNSVNKITTFALLSNANVPHLTYTISRHVAQQWLNKDIPVVVRHKLKGYLGAGIEVIYPSTFGNDDPVLEQAPLYTKLYPKTHEFRIYVVDGKIIQVVQKKRITPETMKRLGVVEVDEVIRSDTDRGWVHAINNLICDQTPEGGRDVLEKIALNATKALGLDYSGMDIAAIYEGTTLKDARVIESNSAPGVDGKTTFKLFTDAIQKMVG